MKWEDVLSVRAGIKPSRHTHYYVSPNFNGGYVRYDYRKNRAFRVHGDGRVTEMEIRAKWVDDFEASGEWKRVSKEIVS